MELDELTGEIIDAAITIHKELGPGLLESVYEKILAFELNQRGILVERQVPIPIYYAGTFMGIGFRADLLVEKSVIVEIKSVEVVTPVFKKKTIGYLKLMDLKVGLLINFNVELLKHGITRLINNNFNSSFPP